MVVERAGGEGGVRVFGCRSASTMPIPGSSVRIEEESFDVRGGIRHQTPYLSIECPPDRSSCHDNCARLSISPKHTIDSHPAGAP
jgi:hypothetical protein